MMNFFMNAAYAAETTVTSAAKSNGFSTLLLFSVIFLLFYLLIIRPQSKRAKDHRSMVNKLTSGDEVITTGGILGKITAVNEGYFTVEIADNITVHLQKSYIVASLPKGTYKATTV